MDQLVSSKPMMPIAAASLYSCRSPLRGRLGMDPQVLAQVQTAACRACTPQMPAYIQHNNTANNNDNNIVTATFITWSLKYFPTEVISFYALKV